MRRCVPPAVALAVVLAAGWLSASAAASALARTLGRGIAAAGSASSAYVVDLNTGTVLYSARAATPRLPASVEKLYTTSTALLRYGPNATLTTGVYGTGRLEGHTWLGNLYLKGGGDPTFGSAGFDRLVYGGGTTVQRLAGLLKATGIRAVRGQIVGDESYLDSARGTPATKGEASLDVEGQLSGLIYNRGFTTAAESVFQPRPALFTAQAFAGTLAADGVQIPRSTAIRSGRTPTGATALATEPSAKLATLIRWTNAPSDNFLAETLAKDLGARFGAAGTTAAGVAVIKSQIAKSFGIAPALNDGSGLSHSDYTTPIEVVKLLRKMARTPSFVNSLAVAGESGTLQHEMNGTVAQGRCRGKTGTLLAVSNLAGYCSAQDGHTLAFAFLMSRVNPDYAHPIQNQMTEALAAYDG